jgi:hypothetical protein
MEDEQPARRRAPRAAEVVTAALLCGVIVLMGVLLIGHLPT